MGMNPFSKNKILLLRGNKSTKAVFDSLVVSLNIGIKQANEVSIHE